MNVTSLINSVERMKQHGDAVRIASLVNARRAENNEKKYSASAIRSMLNGSRTMASDVEEVVTKYYEAQETILIY